MSKKDYMKAASIAANWYRLAVEKGDGRLQDCATAVEAAFVSLFREESPRFDVERFRAACVPQAPKRSRLSTAP